MPVGVPKVPYIIPVIPDPEPESESEDKDKDKDKEEEEEREEWIEVYDRLYRIRSLFLFDDLSDEIANHIIGLMAFLNIDDNTQEQFLFINSPGGGMVNGLGVHDMSRAVLPDVNTLCVGDAISMAALILAGGADNKRTAFPHSTIMLHQPEIKEVGGLIHELVLDGDDLNLIRIAVENIYEQRTGQPICVIRKDMIRDHFMTAPEAQKYGLVDSLGED
uniref:ATP-dependent Clp protease proteolytic subunit n=1 Tax=Cyphia dentariifolia TaxID=2041117 RepID=A0A291F3X8_9ASTR|nr:ATP-dependent protease proteolytic subunit [Cyphia dentariifolia]ATG26823.1 ATP-dependent protease proteolytic subunit [Cyphia dentariifolia]